MKNRQSGNAMIYILIALALLGALTMVLSRGGNEGGDSLAEDQAELLTTRMSATAGAVKGVVDQMMMSGTAIASLNFITPDDAAYDTPPNHNKVFHPDGGGLTLDADPKLFTGADTTPEPGWYLGRFNNIAWTPTAANDIVLAAHDISSAVCANINEKITGDDTIPALAGTGDPATYFINTSFGGPANANLTATECAACEGFPQLCVSDTGGTQFTYYSIISGQ